MVALTGMGMLATTGVIVSEDTFGPVADNAAGIAEMSGEFEGEPERIMVSLDAVGNTTKAVTKGFAIGSAVIASVALFASYVETIGGELDPLKGLTGNKLFNNFLTQINLANPKVLIGLLVGGSVSFLFSALAIRAVGRTAGVVVQEVRSQFADGGIMAGTKKPDYGPVIDICTAASLRELATPALLAVLTPLIIGFGINFYALGAFLAGVILTGQLMANYLSNAGGAWDNAKKYIEDGNEGGKGSEAHKAAVIGDTVGDPFKDTAGPALNPLIKVMNLVSLLVLPAIISLRNNDWRFAIAGVASLVLIGAVLFSKRKSGGFGEESEIVAEAMAEHGLPRGLLRRRVALSTSAPLTRNLRRKPGTCPVWRRKFVVGIRFGQSSSMAAWSSAASASASRLGLRLHRVVTAGPPPLEERRDQRQHDDQGDDRQEVLVDAVTDDVREQVPGQRDAEHPDERADHVEGEERAAGHAADAGEHRCERADDGHEPRQDHRLRSVLLEELLGAVDELLFEEARLLPAEDPRPRLLPDGEPDLVADHRRREAADQDGGEVELALLGEQPGSEEQRVAGEEEAEQQPGLGEDDQHEADLAVRAQRVDHLLRVE